MRPIDNIGIKNFRIFDDTNGFFEELKNITLFTGANNTGKSSIIKFLQMLKNSVAGDIYPFSLDLTDQEHLLGDFQNLLHNKDDQNIVILLPFTFLGLTNIYLSLTFFVDPRDPYKAGLRKIEVLDKSDDIILFRFNYIDATDEEKKADQEAYEAELAEYNLEKNRLEMERLEREKTEGSNPLRGLYYQYQPSENPLSAYVDWSINSGKLGGYLSQLLSFYETYQKNKKDDDWLTEMDALADEKSLPFVPSSFAASFKSNLDIETWKTFQNGLDKGILSGRSKIGDRDFEPDEPYFPIITIEGILYSTAMEILRDNLKWKNKLDEDSNYYIIEDCFKYSWKEAVQRIRSINYISTVREQNARIYNAGTNSPFINLLKSFRLLERETIYFINKYLKAFKIGKEMEIKYQLDYQLISVSIKDEAGGKRELVDFGYGIKQLILILIQIGVLAQKSKRIKHVWHEYGDSTVDYFEPSVLLIEEPETNLHPKWQSLLAEMFVETNQRFNIQLIIETHSEYLIRKFQTLVASKKLDSRAIKIFYLRGKGLETTDRKQIETVNVMDDGTIDYKIFDGGFFDEADKLELSLLNIQRDLFYKEFNDLKVDHANGLIQIADLESRIDHYVSKANIDVYKQLIEARFDTSKLSPITVQYLSSGEFFLANTSDPSDFSPVIIQYGRALENELKQIFNVVDPQKKWMIGIMQGCLEKFKNGITSMPQCNATEYQSLLAELNNSFTIATNLRIDLLNQLREVRNSAGHAGTIKTKVQTEAYIQEFNLFLSKWIDEKKS